MPADGAWRPLVSGIAVAPGIISHRTRAATHMVSTRAAGRFAGRAVAIQVRHFVTNCALAEAAARARARLASHAKPGGFQQLLDSLAQ